MPTSPGSMDVRIGAIGLPGLLDVPTDAEAIVLLAHGSGSGRLSQRNAYVARALRDVGLATLLFDLLSEEGPLTDSAEPMLRVVPQGSLLAHYDHLGACSTISWLVACAVG